MLRVVALSLSLFLWIVPTIHGRFSSENWGAALLAAGARSEIIVAATHGLFVVDAAVRKVFVTDTVRVSEQNWPQLHVISIAPLIAGAVQRFLADGSLDELC